MSYIEQLVPLYANYDVADVKANPELIEKAFGKPLQELAKVSGFPKEQEFVESLKMRIEANKNHLDTPDKNAQIGKCLRLLLQLVLFDQAEPSTVKLKMETLRDLFIKMYAEGNGWSKGQRLHFDFVFERLKEWNSYFLSYTNEGGKIINAKYKNVIKTFADPVVLRERDWNTHNILADAIVNLLRKRLPRRGFYDKEKINVGANLDDEITPAASKTFAFVQLVQLETFDTSKPVNWSFREYQIFQKYNELELNDRAEYRQIFKKRFVAILAGDKHQIQLLLLPFEFEPWSNRIFSEAHFLTISGKSSNFEGDIQKLYEAIVNLAHQIIDNVPT